VTFDIDAKTPRTAPRELGGGALVPPGFGQRDQAAFHRLVVDIIERGHSGPEGGEPYVAAVLREEREEAEAKACGATYRKRRYGPSLVGNPDMARALSQSFRGGGR
jgi:hypothetical protein